MSEKQQSTKECQGPTYTEVMRSLYSCYLGDDFMAGVDQLQEKHPQLKPVVLVSSIFSLVPLVWFGACVAGIFATNMVLGVFTIQCYHVLCHVPKFETTSQAIYSKAEVFSESILASVQAMFSKKPDDDSTTAHNSDDENVQVYPIDSISQQDVRQEALAPKPANNGPFGLHLGPRTDGENKGLFGLPIGQKAEHDKGLLGIKLLNPDPLGLLHRPSQQGSAKRMEASRRPNQSSQAKPRVPHLLGFLNKPKIATVNPAHYPTPKDEDYFPSKPQPKSNNSSSPSDSE